MIPFNKPYLSGNETRYIKQAVKAGKISGNGMFTRQCHKFFEERYSFKKCLLTTSGTAALEMAALLLNIEPGDEVIMPSYTFVSTANAFVLRGAKIVFADSRSDHPGMDEDKIEELITSKTKAIVPVHYGGMACAMDKIMAIAARHGLLVVEDAAQAIGAYYKRADGSERPLGGIGHLAAFSFHETKNIQCGEGGLLVINDDRFKQRAEIIWEKGTNRAAFFRGEVSKYNWVDMGSSFLPSELNAAFLFAQLENFEKIQKKRKAIWHHYYKGLKHLAERNVVAIPLIPQYATNSGHLFYLLCREPEERTALIRQLKTKGIQTVFHYLALHRAPFFKGKHDGRELPHADRFSTCLVRLPLFYELAGQQVRFIVNEITDYCK